MRSILTNQILFAFELPTIIHYIVRQGLVALLHRESDVKVVTQASNGQEAVTMFRQHQPDVTLMDLRMSVMDGVAAIAAICAEFPSARIVLLTSEFQRWYKPPHLSVESIPNRKSKILKPPHLSVGSI